jgi:hypothetical protein
MRSSAENRIARASATLSASEVRIPCLQEERLVPRYDIFKLSQLGPVEAAGACELDMLRRIPGQVKAHPRNRLTPGTGTFIKNYRRK